MTILLEAPPQRKIIYPASDGQPMADNTLQFTWITVIKENCEVIFRNDPNVFVAGDLLWYPVEGKPGIRVAPDVLIAVGCPKGYRGSYMQWVEGDIPPQVVFEVLSPGNTIPEMTRKFAFFNATGLRNIISLTHIPAKYRAGCARKARWCRSSTWTAGSARVLACASRRTAANWCSTGLMVNAF